MNVLMVWVWMFWYWDTREHESGVFAWGFPKYCVLQARMAVAEGNVIRFPSRAQLDAIDETWAVGELGRWANPKL